MENGQKRALPFRYGSALLLLICPMLTAFARDTGRSPVLYRSSYLGTGFYSDLFGVRLSLVIIRMISASVSFMPILASSPMFLMVFSTPLTTMPSPA